MEEEGSSEVRPPHRDPRSCLDLQPYANMEGSTAEEGGASLPFMLKNKNKPVPNQRASNVLKMANHPYAWCHVLLGV